MAQRILSAGRPFGNPVDQRYHCDHCDREVVWPEILYDDGRCEGCTSRQVKEN